MTLAVLWAMSLYWHLPILIVLISLVYSGTRYDAWPAILTEAARWGLRMAGFLIVIVLVLYLVSLWISA